MKTTSDVKLVNRAWEQIADVAHTRHAQKRLAPKVEKGKVTAPEEVREALLADKVGASVVSQNNGAQATPVPVRARDLTPLSKEQREAIKELRNEVAGRINQSFMRQGQLEVDRIYVDSKSPDAEEKLAKFDHAIAEIAAGRKELVNAEKALNSLLGSGIFDIGFTATGHLGIGIPVLAYAGAEVGGGVRDAELDFHMPTARGMAPFLNVEGRPDTGIQIKPGSKYVDYGRSDERGRYLRFQIPAIGYAGLYKLDSARPGLEFGILPTFGVGVGGGIESPLLRPVVRPMMQLQNMGRRVGAHIAKPISAMIKSLKAKFQPQPA